MLEFNEKMAQFQSKIQEAINFARDNNIPVEFVHMSLCTVTAWIINHNVAQQTAHATEMKGWSNRGSH